MLYSYLVLGLYYYMSVHTPIQSVFFISLVFPSNLKIQYIVMEKLDKLLK